MKKILFILLGLSFTQISNAQFFVQQLPIDQIYLNDEGYIVKENGDTLRGNITSVSHNDGRIRSVTIKTGDEKFKFKHVELQTIAVIPSVVATHEEMALISTLKRSSDTSFLAAVETEWKIFHRIPDQVRPQNKEFAQLVNPGFDSKIKVYANPMASTSSMSSGNMQLTGGDDSFIIVKGQEEAFVQRRGKYKKTAWEALFDKCPAIDAENMKWPDFAIHVYKHEQECE